VCVCVSGVVITSAVFENNNKNMHHLQLQQRI
jgi:hypothetical protein